MPQPFVTSLSETPVETWDDPTKGDLMWQTLFSSDVTPTGDMCSGVAILSPGREHKRHRHAEAEIYYVLEGTGRLTIDDEVFKVTAGSAAYIPGNRWHGIVNDGDVPIKIFYVFSTPRFSDIEYHFE